MAKAHAPLQINLVRLGLIKWSPGLNAAIAVQGLPSYGNINICTSSMMMVLVRTEQEAVPYSELPELEAKITYFRTWVHICRISTAWRCSHHHCIMWSSCVLSKLCTGAGAFLERDLMTQHGMAYLCFLPTGNYRSISDLGESQDNSCLMLSSTVVTEKATTVKSIFFILPLVPVLSFHCDIRPFNIVFSLLSCLFRRHHPDALY